MKILIACDKFKGSLTAPEACAAIAKGLRDGLGDSAAIRSLPIADGGDGLAETLLAACGGERIRATVRGPLGEAVAAAYVVIDGGATAVIEMAAASGLVLLGDRAKDPRRASTYGTGELIRHAIDQGVSDILLGIGGSATNDGGSGMAEALGFRFEDPSRKTLVDLPLGLESVARIMSPDQATKARVTVACDVTNPLLGETGCTRVYGPQKGIAPDDFAFHEERLARLVAACGEGAVEAARMPGSGAAGGLGFGAMMFLGAVLEPGFDLVAEKLGIAAAIAEADLVITGEGRLDRQSLQGKGPHGVARLARGMGKNLAAFCGSLESPDLESEFGTITEIADPSTSLAENMSRAAEHLRAAARNFARSLPST